MRPPANRTFSLTCAWPNYLRVPLPPAAVELLTALSKVLARWGRWYVFGAQARWSRWRRRDRPWRSCGSGTTPRSTGGGASRSRWGAAGLGKGQPIHLIGVEFSREARNVTAFEVADG